MNELQLVFVFETALLFIVIASTSALAFGKGRLWVVGHASFLGTGGVYALASQRWPIWVSVLVALAVLCIGASLLSFAAALLEGDRFVIVSLGWAYATYAIFFAKFGDVAPDVAGAKSPAGRILILSLLLVTAFGVSVYASGLKRSSMNTILLLARDHPQSLQSAALSVRPLRFWLHLIAVLPVGFAGILMVIFYRTYSPASHSAPRCLLLFVVGIPFGTNSLRGSVAAAICLSSLTRAIDLALSSDLANLMYHRFAVWTNSGTWVGTASNLSAPLAQMVLAALFIILLRILPAGLFGKESLWIRR